MIDCPYPNQWSLFKVLNILSSGQPYKYRLVRQIDDVRTYDLSNTFVRTRFDKTRYVIQYTPAKTGEYPSAPKCAC